jgi:hypothetical protein
VRTLLTIPYFVNTALFHDDKAMAQTLRVLQALHSLAHNIFNDKGFEDNTGAKDGNDSGEITVCRFME